MTKRSELRTSWGAFKKGQRVQDTWYRDVGAGKILRKDKTKLQIEFASTWGIVQYDRAHATRFLEIMKRKPAGRKRNRRK